jgi:hypothetical protein
MEVIFRIDHIKLKSNKQKSLLTHTADMAEYCSIRGEGFTETDREGRTVYMYSADNTFTEECRGCKYPDKEDLQDDGEIKEFVSEEQILNRIISVINLMSRDDYYYEIYISFPKEHENKNLIEKLNLQQPLDRQPESHHTFRNDDKYVYYLYPKHIPNHTITRTKRCRSSKKEVSFIDTCKKVLPDLDTQVMFKLEDKNYCVDGFCEGKK